MKNAGNLVQIMGGLDSDVELQTPKYDNKVAIISVVVNRYYTHDMVKK